MYKAARLVASATARRSSSTLTCARRCAVAASSNNNSTRPSFAVLGGTAPVVSATTRHLSSSLSSFAEPDPTLFAAQQAVASAAATTTETNISNNENDSNAQLRADIRVMGSLLGKVIQEHEGPELFAKVETLRALAKTWRDNGHDPAAFADMADFCRSLSSQELYKVARSFTHFLGVANAAESHHRGRRVQQSLAAGEAKADSCAGAIPALLEQGHSADAIFQALATQTTELVLTAHPTEVNRRTILEKKRRIQTILTTADTYRAAPATVSHYKQHQLDDALYREISSLWLSDEVARTKPTPQTEAEKGTLVLETVLWEALPQWMRQLDATCQQYLHSSLPLTAAPVKFASWMGGDRDGNPNVKPDTTRHVCLRNRWKAATLFLHDVRQLASELSINECSDELRAAMGGREEEVVREPYRVYLRPMLEKLERTAAWAQDGLDALQAGRHAPSMEDDDQDDIYLSTDQFRDELLLAHRSLVATGNAVTADGRLTDILRNVASFGLALLPLDVRQESDRHEEALDAITRFLGLGSYSQWDEETKISWLTSQIASKRPLLRQGVWKEHPEVFSPTVCDTLEIMQMIAEQHPGSLGAYVISQATSASDVLAVLLLQLDAGVKKPLRVAPLFETLDDLKGAGETMKKLFSLPVYMGVIQGKQEVMIGYSDSAKGTLVYEVCERESERDGKDPCAFF